MKNCPYANTTRTEWVRQVLCEMFHVDHLAAFVQIGQSEVGHSFWFRIPKLEGIRLARLDGENNLHLYKMTEEHVRYADGEMRNVDRGASACSNRWAYSPNGIVRF